MPEHIAIYIKYLTHLCLASYKRDIDSADPDQMLDNVASDLALHCLH